MNGLFGGIEWDSGNWPKCGKHGVSIAEIEAVLRGQPSILPDPAHSRSDTRLLAIGRTGEGRYVFICFTVRQQAQARLLRPISARYMHRKEIESYEKTRS